MGKLVAFLSGVCYHEFVKGFLLQIIAGILGLWLAVNFLPQVEFSGPWQLLVIAGFILGVINFFIKPLLNLITLPLRILTFGLFGLLLNMGFIWLIDIFFPELIIPGLWPLFLVTLIVWATSLFLAFSFRGSSHKLTDSS